MDVLQEKFEHSGRINLGMFGVDLQSTKCKEFSCRDVSCRRVVGGKSVLFKYTIASDSFDVDGAEGIVVSEEECKEASKAAHEIVEQLHFYIVAWKKDVGL